MKKKIFIHIGIGKTGTSAIQSVLYLNRESLKHESVLYPKNGIRADCHHELAKLQAEKLDVKTLKTYVQLIDEIDNSKCNKIIISSEFFVYCKQSYIFEVANILNKYDVKIIFFVRKQSELIESTYLQWIKKNQKFDGGFDDFYERLKDSFDFNRLIAPWEKAFGESNIIARVYNRDLFGDIVKVVFDIVDVDIVLKGNTPKVNESLMAEFVPLIELIDKENCVRDRELIINELLNLSAKFKKYKTTSLIKKKTLENIFAYYNEKNILFSRKYLNDLIIS